MSGKLLEIEELSVAFRGLRGATEVLSRASFAVEPGEIVGIVGESGSGKSVMALAIMRLLGAAGMITAGQVRFEGRDLATLREAELLAVRGRRIGMVFQEPMTSLNPLFTVGYQLGEVLGTHLGLTGAAGRARVVELLGKVGIAAPAERAAAYPHQLSGGMRQRVMIAMAMACRPKLLIADEPTTALDVTIQAQILELMRRISRSAGAAILLITHDMGVVARMADRVLVIYAGQIVEDAPARDLFARPAHPYTRLLLAAMPTPRRRSERLPVIPGALPAPDRLPSGCRFHPRCPMAIAPCRTSPPPMMELAASRRTRCIRGARAAGRDRPRSGGGAMSEPILVAEHLSKDFSVAGGRYGPARRLRAVEDVSFTLSAGETLGVVGESGCGKSTVARMVLRLTAPSAGEIHFLGQDITHLSERALRPLRRHLQAVFQDPISSLNPRLRVGDIIAEPLTNLGMPARRPPPRGSPSCLNSWACRRTRPAAIRMPSAAGSGSGSRSRARWRSAPS